SSSLKTSFGLEQVRGVELDRSSCRGFYYRGTTGSASPSNPIAEAAHSVNQLLRVSIVNFLAQQLDKRLQRIVFDSAVIAPHSLQDGIAGQDTPCIPHKKFQQCIFFFG